MNKSAHSPGSPWFVYMIRCSDNTIYTGITNNLLKRIPMHNSVRGAAKYTRSRRPVILIYFEEHNDRSSATRREMDIKRCTRKSKELLADGFLDTRG